MEKMTSRKDALALLFENWTVPTQTETVPVTEALGRVPVGEYTARHSIPVVRSSAMDGVAVPSSRFADGMPDTTATTLTTSLTPSSGSRM